MQITRLATYMNYVSDMMECRSRLASLTDHRPDIGKNREVVLDEFLGKHLPRCLTPTLGGYIIGSGGQESRQLDIIVSNDLCMKFDENARTFVTVEGVAAVISVKSDLDKKELYDALLNLASIPQVSPTACEIDARERSYDDFVNNFPVLNVFAYSGIAIETCAAHVATFYNEHQNIPMNRRVQSIVVNGKYVVQYVTVSGTGTNGTVVEAGTIMKLPASEPTRGFPLLKLLYPMTLYVGWIPSLKLNLMPYVFPSTTEQ